MKIIKNYIDDDCYIKIDTNKQGICLMDSFFSGNTKSILAQTHSTYIPIAHFLIKRDGDIIQNYDVRYYNTHFYSKQEFLNKKVITIAFENYNKLYHDFADNSYKNFYGLKVDDSEIYTRDFKKYKLDHSHSIWHSYTDLQIKSSNFLINKLVKENLIKKDIQNHNFLISKEDIRLIKGVFCASNVEVTRYDVNPAFPFKRIQFD